MQVPAHVRVAPMNQGMQHGSMMAKYAQSSMHVDGARHAYSGAAPGYASQQHNMQPSVMSPSSPPAHQTQHQLMRLQQQQQQQQQAHQMRNKGPSPSATTLRERAIQQAKLQLEKEGILPREDGKMVLGSMGTLMRKQPAHAPVAAAQAAILMAKPGVTTNTPQHQHMQMPMPMQSQHAHSQHVVNQHMFHQQPQAANNTQQHHMLSAQQLQPQLHHHQLHVQEPGAHQQHQVLSPVLRDSNEGVGDEVSSSHAVQPAQMVHQEAATRKADAGKRRPSSRGSKASGGSKVSTPATPPSAPATPQSPRDISASASKRAKKSSGAADTSINGRTAHSNKAVEEASAVQSVVNKNDTSERKQPKPAKADVPAPTVKTKGSADQWCSQFFANETANSAETGDGTLRSPLRGRPPCKCITCEPHISVPCVFLSQVVHQME
jgi:hypothetical protein